MRHRNSSPGRAWRLEAISKAPRSRFLRWLPASIGLVAWLTAPAVRAETECPSPPPDAAKAREAAKSWFLKGLAFRKARKHALSLAAFQCAQKQAPAPLTLYWIGRAAEAAGKRELALETYVTLESNPPRAVKAYRLRRRIRKLKRKLPRKVVREILARVAARKKPAPRPEPPPSLPTCPGIPPTLQESRLLARGWFLKGVGFYNKKNYALALTAFQCTQKLLPARLTKYWIGRSAESEKKYKLALEVYTSLLSAPPRAVTVEELKRRIAEIKPKVPPEPRKPVVRPSPVPRPVVVPLRPRVVTRPVAPMVKTTVVTRRARLFRILGWVGVGTAAAFLGAGVGMGVILALDRRKIEKATPGTWWDPDLQKRADRKDALTIGMAVSVGAAAALATGATVLLILSRKKERAASVSVVPWQGGGVAVVQGSF